MKNEPEKPHSVDDLETLMKERNYHRDLWKVAAVAKKTAQSKLDQAAEEEALHYRKFQEYEKKILKMATNLKG